jgi:hypothetical protein
MTIVSYEKNVRGARGLGPSDESKVLFMYKPYGSPSLVPKYPLELVFEGFSDWQ